MMLAGRRAAHAPSPVDEVEEDRENVPFEGCLTRRAVVHTGEQSDRCGDRIDIAIT